MRTILIGLIVIVMGNVALADVTSREGGPSEKQMLARGGSDDIDGIAFFRPVLSGVLYRSGFKGGDKDHTGLNQSQRKEFCEQGFSAGFYADFGKNTDYGKTSCGSGAFDYQNARSSRPANVMKAIHTAIVGDSGPVLVHCMWGVHSSGALSAMALVQFCGWSEDRAKAYWDAARNEAPCSGGCDKWIDGKFSHFQVDSTLNISDAQKSAICPK